MKSVLAKFVGNTVLANMLMVMILVAGIAASMMMVREEMPNVSFDEINIKVVFPGADPEEVEEGITRKIEESIKGMEGIKKFRSVSRENMGETEIEILEGYDGREVLDRVRTEIDAISTFPVDAEKPVITMPLHSDPVMALYLNGDMSEKELKTWSYNIKDQLLALDEVSQVSLFGNRDYEINVELSEQKLREYGISFAQVSEGIRHSNLNRSGGIIKNDTDEIRVRTVGRKYTDDELASVVILSSSDGDLITLDKLADIDDGFSEDNVLSKVNGKPAVILSIFKTSEEDTIKIAESVRSFIDEFSGTLPPGVGIGILFDNSDSIRHQINILIKNGIAGLIIVFVILWLFLNARLSFWTGIGILISVVGGVAVVWLLGGTINMISVFGFVMILGIVADDAIVVGESIAWHRKQGKGPFNAAVDGFAEVGLPVVAAVLTTVLAFIPLMFIDGTMGKFIRILPIVVIACLLLSLFESFALLPAHLSHLPDPDRQSTTNNPILKWINFLPAQVAKGLDSFTHRVYSPLLKKILEWRYAFLCFAISLLLVSLGLVQGGFLKFELLSAGDGFYLTSIVEFPEGTSIQITEKAVKEIENAMLRIADRTETKSGDPLIENILSISGQAPHIEPGRLGPAGNHMGGVQVMLLPAEKRGIHTKDLVRMWKEEVGTIYGAKSLSFTGTIMGHPGKPIEIGVDGKNPESITLVVNELKNRLEQFQGVFDIQSDDSSGKDEIQFTLKPEARTLGVTVQDLADQLYTGYYGEEVLRIQRERDSVKIRVRYTQTERQSLSSLDSFMIRTSQGYEVPLNVVAEAKTAPGSSVIVRHNGLRRVTVTADIDSAVIFASEVIEELSSSFFADLKTKYPEVAIVLEGDAGETEESFDTMFMGFILAILAIYMLIATLFHSYLQPLVVLITIPFGMIGAIWGHLLMGVDLTMISMFGMVGLTGIVVNDAIVLIERINANVKEGIPFLEAVKQGGIRRFRAVFLTSITTVGGLAPLVVESDSYATVVIPMAITIVFGIIFATVLTLVLIPSLLVIINDLRLLAHRLKNGVWTERNSVEPAQHRATYEEVIQSNSIKELKPI